MVIVKNTFGMSSVANPKLMNPGLLDTFGGSSLNRMEKKDDIEKLLITPFEPDDKPKRKRKVKDLRSMSQRTKSKIRKKLIALSMVCEKLTFLTLTFVNQVTDELAVKILRAFLDNAKKRNKDFQYLWVAERQTNNEVFKDNIHFHLVTNKYWKIERWLPYWVALQESYGVMRRNQESLPGSAFNIKAIRANNVKGLITYLTKYVTKNSGKFKCQVWNCSQKISRLYTDFYTGIGFLQMLERMEKADMLGGKIKTIRHDFNNLFIYPLNQKNMRFYEKLTEQNKLIWNENKQ